MTFDVLVHGGGGGIGALSVQPSAEFRPSRPFVTASTSLPVCVRGLHPGTHTTLALETGCPSHAAKEQG